VDDDAEVGVLLDPRERRRPRPGAARHQHPRLLPGQGGRDVGEGVPQDVVHPVGHVLDPPAHQHGDVGSGRRRDDLRDLPQRLQRLGGLDQDHAGTADQVRPERQRPVGAGQPGTLGVAVQRPLADEEVLADAHVGGAVQGHRPEGQGAVVVVDDGDLAGPAEREGRRGLVEQEPVGRVDRDQFRRLDVRRTAKEGEDLVHTPGRPTGQETPVEFTGQ
jgi:hypothetical protein